MKSHKAVIYAITSLILLLLFAVAGTGCSGTNSTSSSSAASAAASSTAASTTLTAATTASVNQILIQGSSFTPASLTVKAGDTVTWTNKDSMNHTVTSNSGVFDSGNIAPGASFSYKFDKEGTFDYKCSIHTFMTANVTVQK